MATGEFNKKQFQIRAEAILRILKMESLNSYEIETRFNVSRGTANNYIKYFIKNKMIYIDSYRTAYSKQRVPCYRAGNKKNAVMIPLAQISKAEKMEKVKLSKVVRCDVAAAWMANPC